LGRQAQKKKVRRPARTVFISFNAFGKKGGMVQMAVGLRYPFLDEYLRIPTTFLPFFSEFERDD
jgi:hypothetical protein